MQIYIIARGIKFSAGKSKVIILDKKKDATSTLMLDWFKYEGEIKADALVR